MEQQVSNRGSNSDPPASSQCEEETKQHEVSETTFCGSEFAEGSGGALLQTVAPDVPSVRSCGSHQVPSSSKSAPFASRAQALMSGAASVVAPLSVHSGSQHASRKGNTHNLARLAVKHNLYAVQLDGDSGGIEMQAASQYLLRAVTTREKYKSVDKGQKEGTGRLVPPVVFSFETGVAQFTDQKTEVLPWEQFYDDVIELCATMQHPDCRRACSQRLQVLEEKYNLYKLCSSNVENPDHHRHDVGVFSDCTKVDNSVYLSCMVNSELLREYIQDKVEYCGSDEVRYSADKTEVHTLSTTCDQLGFTEVEQLTIEGLGLSPPNEKQRYHYDPLDLELNRTGRNCAELLQLFLTHNTLNKGKYFAEIVKPTLSENEQRMRNPQATECMVELCGTSAEDWEQLAAWAQEHNLLRMWHNRWFVALPRRRIRSDSTKDALENHQQHLENIFLPLFTATLAPEDPKNASIVALLQNLGGFVIVSDEEERNSTFERKLRRPVEVPWSENVCDLYFAYHVWANLCSLNALRRRKGLNTLQLRAFAGNRDGQIDVLVYSYLLCDSLVNGVLLEHNPVLQYLYGAGKIGLVMMPLCNNGMGLPYMQNPFPVFFRRGLLVTLTTNQPLLFHHSKEPLIEEYGTASKLFQLSGTDACEIALNSVIVSSFPADVKALWLGDSFLQEGIQGNMLEFSKVPTCRLVLRQELWQTELNIIHQAAVRNTRGKRGAFPLPTLLSTPPPLMASGSHAGDSTEVEPSGVTLQQAVTMMQSSQMPFLARDPHTDFPRVVFLGPLERDPSDTLVVTLLHRALQLRSQYVRQHNIRDVDGRVLRSDDIEHAFRRDDTFDEDEWMFKTVEGVVVPHEVHQIPRLPKDMFHFDDFRQHVQELRAMLENAHVRNFATRRLNLLERKFMLHLAVNRSLEAGTTASKASQNRDFYQATKVDNNVRMESGMTARQLLNFIVSKANNNGDDIVAHQEGKEPQTLRQLLQELNISPSTLTVDDLNVQVDTTLGVGSAQYTPGGRDVLCTLLLNTDNQMKGRYFAELTKLTFENFEHDRFTFTENRLPIYGASPNEWGLLSDWFDTHGMASVHNRWMVQIPRIYGYLRECGKVQSFTEYIENIFKPLWTVSLHPSKDPRLFHFLNHISGFDCVEDERRHDIPLNNATKPPHEWTTEEEPPYNYYMYHVWANIYSLNEFRRRRKFSTFTFRPSCGETGPVEHLIGGFLLANAINYGVTLADDTPLQYLFYLARIGVTVSPLSNNTKVLGYLDNPFPTFFRRGLNVSLGTDSPLMFHHTQEPLLEEYSIASKVWKLSPNDMCEIARNSVLLSGFDAAFKRERLGDLFFLSSSRSNDASHTHLSDIRVAYRFETYHAEIAFLEMISTLNFPKALLTLSEERALEADFLEAVKKKEKQLGCIIEVKTEEEDIKRLEQSRAALLRQVREAEDTVEELRRQNKQLTEKLAEERARDQHAQQMRRKGLKERVVGISDPEGRRQTSSSNADMSSDHQPSLEISVLEQVAKEETNGEDATATGQSQHLGGAKVGLTALSPTALEDTSPRSAGFISSGNVADLDDNLDTAATTSALVGMLESMWKEKPAGASHSGGHTVTGGDASSTFPPINVDAVTLSERKPSGASGSTTKRGPPPPRRTSANSAFVFPKPSGEGGSHRASLQGFANVQQAAREQEAKETGSSHRSSERGV